MDGTLKYGIFENNTCSTRQISFSIIHIFAVNNFKKKFTLNVSLCTLSSEFNLCRWKRKYKAVDFGTEITEWHYKSRNVNIKILLIMTSNSNVTHNHMYLLTSTTIPWCKKKKLINNKSIRHTFRCTVVVSAMLMDFSLIVGS